MKADEERPDESYWRWFEEGPEASALSPEQWMEAWFKLADEIMKDAPPGPTAREIIEEDRNRLERGRPASPVDAPD